MTFWERVIAANLAAVAANCLTMVLIPLVLWQFNKWSFLIFLISLAIVAWGLTFLFTKRYRSFQ